MDPNASRYQLLQEMFDISGQVVAITGGGGILCGTIARQLARLGAKIVILDMRPEAVDRVVQDIHNDGGEAIGMPCNVLSKEELMAAAEQIMGTYGGVYGLVNGAGGNRAEATTTPELSFFDMPEESFRHVFGLNFMGTVLSTQVLGKVMAENGQGSIINISSINGIRPLTNIPAYCAGKAAVKNFTEWLAVHVSQYYSPRIRVNAIAPGFFLTDQNRYLLIDQDTGGATPRGQTIIDHVPMSRYGEPSELVSTVLWLLSPSASFVHGATIPVDGGFLAFSGV